MFAKNTCVFTECGILAPKTPRLEMMYNAPSLILLYHVLDPRWSVETGFHVYVKSWPLVLTWLIRSHKTTSGAEWSDCGLFFLKITWLLQSLLGD